MEVILIVIASTLIAACFLFAFAFGFFYGQKTAERKNQEEIIKITNKNKKVVSKYKNFVDFSG